MKYGVDRKALMDNFGKSVDTLLEQLKEKNDKLKTSVKNEIERLGK